VKLACLVSRPFIKSGRLSNCRDILITKEPAYIVCCVPPDDYESVFLSASLYIMLQICSRTLFEKTPVLRAFSRTPTPTIMPDLNKLPDLPKF